MFQFSSFVGQDSFLDPLNKLLRKNVPYVWTKEQQLSFDSLKQYLTQAPILAYPNFDQEFILFTDA